jgi:hypothetical protein
VRRHTDAQKDRNAALYRHVLSRVRLKAAAGILSEQDVEALNAMLVPAGGQPETPLSEAE